MWQSVAIFASIKSSSSGLLESKRNAWRKKKGEAQALFQAYLCYQAFQKGSLTQVLSLVCVAFCWTRNRVFLSGRKVYWLRRFFHVRLYDALVFIFHIGVLFSPWEESSKRSLCVGRWHGRRVKLVLQTGLFQIPP